MIISGWRISDPKFAATPIAMMSGEGAYLYGGRWNNKGVRVVYLGTSLAQASMELLVHLGRANILDTYRKMDVFFDDSLIDHIALDDLPNNWAEPSMAPSVQNVGDTWVENQSSLVLQVPSASVLGEYNFLINPQHPDMKKVTFGSITPFNYDPRLIK